MYAIMICENNPQPDLCCVDYRAMEWLSPDGLQGFGVIKYRYPNIRRNIPLIIPKEYNVYNYDLWI